MMNFAADETETHQVLQRLLSLVAGVTLVGGGGSTAGNNEQLHRSVLNADCGLSGCDFTRKSPGAVFRGLLAS